MESFIKTNSSNSYMETEGIIYIADDDECIRRLTEKLLTRNGFSVDIFCNGVSLEKKILEGNFEGVKGIVTDYEMPGGVSGGDIVERYALLLEEREIPVIVVSGNHSKKKEVLDNGAYAFLKKPSDFYKLPRVLREAFKNYSNNKQREK